MNPRARRLLRRIFIAAFFLIAPAIILSTAGYRYNFSRQRFERTGVMTVESRPEGAAIRLDGKLQDQETPARLQRLTPGPYAVRVEKSGHHAWEKSVIVRSRTTTFLNEIALFRDAAPALLADAGTTSGETFSEGARYAAAMVATRSGSELMIVDLQGGAQMRPYRSSAAAGTFRLSWSRDGRKLLMRRSSRVPEHLLWNAASPEGVRDLAEETSLAISDALWAQDADQLYASAEGVLYALDPGLALATPTGPSAASAVVADGTLYGIEPATDGAGRARLVRRRLGEAEFETVAELPSADYIPLAGRDRKVAYLSTSDERLFVIDDSAGGQPEAFEGLGRGGAWSADGERLLFWNDLEIRLYDSRNDSDELITRLSGPIRQAAWHRPEWNAIYAAKGSLFAIETADRFGRVTVPLAGFEELRSFAVSRDGGEAYLFGKKDGRQGIWQLQLR